MGMLRRGFRRGLAGLLLLAVLLGSAALPADVAVAQGPERISFPPGATSVNLAGALDNGAAKQYVLRAAAGQTMTVSAAYVAYSYQINVLEPGGRSLGVAAAGGSWSGVLPSTGDYYLIVTPGVGNARVFYNFVLAITGSTAPTPTTPPPAVERIRFAPNATSATVYGQVSPGLPRTYVLAARAGQSMTVQTNSSGPFRITITGADGAQLGAVDANQSLTVHLPRQQDYFLRLDAPIGGATAAYTLQVTIVGSTPPTPTPIPQPQTQRITFAPGAVSATVSGAAGSARPASYVLRALAGQDMTVQIYGSGPFHATLTGADGSFLGSASSQGAGGTGTMTARLPRTQDYYINISAPSGAPALNFTLVVTVVGTSPQRPTPAPSTQRITFARGAVSATVNGTTPQNYVLKALRGQTMYVELFTYGAAVQARIETANGQFLGTATESLPWSGTLPATQDYYFRVVAPQTAGGSTSFSLRVTIY